MDLEAVWHTHKPFILKVLGGAVALLLLMALNSSVATSANDQAKRNASQQAAIADKLAQLEGAEGLEKGRADALGGKLEPVLTKTLMWEADLVLPDGHASPVRFYDSARRRALVKARKHAERWDARIPQGPALGLPEQVAEGQVVEALARADLVQRVVVKMLDAGVRKITSIHPGEAEYHRRSGDGRFLRELPIEVTFSGDVPLLAEVLAAFQVKGAFLELRGCTLSRETDRPESPLTIELALQGLAIVDEAPAEATEARRRGRRPRGSTRRVRQFQRER